MQKTKSGLDTSQFIQDITEGLGNKIKNIQSKYLYDHIGSQLFEQICLQPEYYLTRTEASVLTKYSTDIINLTERRLNIIELGSGSSTKTKILLQSLIKDHDELYYFPIDVSHTILHDSIRKLSSDFLNLHIIGISSDYTIGLKKAAEFINEQYHVPDRKLVLFLGSSIGNFEPVEAISFLQMVRDRLDKNDMFLVGFDLKKNQEILNRAYNDKAGITARFNLNLLARINREIGGEFDLESFNHHAYYDENLGRVEMHLVSKRDQDVYIKGANKTFSFKENEIIHTENSYKYDLKQIYDLASDSGFEVRQNFLDERRWFTLTVFSPI